MLKAVKRKNTAYSVIKEREKYSINGYPFYTGCSRDIVLFIKQFFKKVKNLDIDWDNTEVTTILIELSTVVWNLSLNTIVKEKISDSNLKAIEKIFDEINKILDSVIEGKKISYQMLSCIGEILFMNMIKRNIKGVKSDIKITQDGMFFKDYENLYQIIYKIINEWEDLVKRGFDEKNFEQLKHFKDALAYYEKIGKEKSEQEKYDMLIGILDGTMKFKPIYTPVAYQIVPLEYNLNVLEEDKKYPEYSLLPKGE